LICCSNNKASSAAHGDLLEAVPLREVTDEAFVGYNCSKCPAYCCTYPVIVLTKHDVERLAKHFGLTFEEAEKKFTRSAHGYKRIIRRKKDEHFGRACRFLDPKTRRCTIYKARPAVCRQFPVEKRCGYYDFLKFEREHQNDQTLVATTDNGLWK
jgi:Fe-S-cluster containining protein